jgi:anti-sigma factor RsiW
MTAHSSSSNAEPTPIDCATAVRRLWDYLDGRLADVAREEVEVHLATCAKCPPHFAFAERMKLSLAAAAVTAISDEEEERLRVRVRGALARFALEGDDDTRNSS